MSDAIELAMRLDQIEIRYQPQYAGADGRIIGAETLARWLHPIYGTIGAREMFAAAAAAGLGLELSRHATARAIAAASPWPEQLGLSLNVAPRQLLQPEFVSTLAGQLDKAGIAAAQVTVEITEELLLDDLDLAARRLAALRQLGVKVALDDFGAGFCNFEYLKRLPLDALKLDRSMVQGIAESERDLAVLRAIVALAQALGLAIIAEGVETDSQRQIVVAEGCAAWQGFLGSEPLARASLAQLVASD